LLNASNFNKIGGWSDDKYWMYCEDSDICYKVEKILGKKSALIRDCSINHIGGGASKVDDNSTLMLKLELVISTHNYIYHNSGLISRVIILPSYILKSVVPPLVKLLLSVMFFNQKKIQKYKYLTVGIIEYYIKSIKRRTWRSDKLDA
jgi:GT2 family glycosyltransferase